MELNTLSSTGQHISPQQRMIQPQIRTMLLKRYLTLQRKRLLFQSKSLNKANLTLDPEGALLTKEEKQAHSKFNF